MLVMEDSSSGEETDSETRRKLFFEERLKPTKQTKRLLKTQSPPKLTPKSPYSTKLPKLLQSHSKDLPNDIPELPQSAIPPKLDSSGEKTVSERRPRENFESKLQPPKPKKRHISKPSPSPTFEDSSSGEETDSETRLKLFFDSKLKPALKPRPKQNSPLLSKSTLLDYSPPQNQLGDPTAYALYIGLEDSSSGEETDSETRRILFFDSKLKPAPKLQPKQKHPSPLDYPAQTS